MTRVQPVFKPADFPGTPDEATSKTLKRVFDHMFPGQTNPEIPGKSSAFATVMRSPRLAEQLIKLSDFMIFEMAWTTKRNAMKQLMIQALNLHYKCDFGFQSHIKPALAAGISLEQQALIPFWRNVNAFNDEQRLVIEFAMAVVTGDVPEELFARVVKQYGEQEAIELTAGVAWWSFWAMIAKATGTDFDFGYGTPSA